MPDGRVQAEASFSSLATEEMFHAGLDTMANTILWFMALLLYPDTL